MRIIGRTLLIGVGVLLALGVILIGLFFGLGNSDAFLRWLVSRPEVASVASIDPEHVRGDLFGPIEVDHAIINAGQWRLRISGLVMEWRPIELFERRLVIDALSLQGADIGRDESVVVETAADEDWAGFETPLPIDLNVVNVKQLNLNPPGDPYGQVTDVQARLRLRGNRVELDELKLSRQEGHVAARGRIVLSADVPVELQLEWGLTGTALKLAGDAGVRGDLNGLDVTITTTGDVAATADIDLTRLASPTEFDVRLAVARIDATEFDQLTFDARGQIDGDQNLAMDVQWSNLTWPTPDFDWRSPTGSLHVEGQIPALAMTGDALVDVQSPSVTSTRLSYSGRIDSSVLTVERLGFDGAGGSGNVQGRYEMESGNLAATGNVKGLDTALLSAQWPSKLDLGFELQRRQQAWNVNLRQLEGSLRGRPIKVNATVGLSNEDLATANIQVDANLTWGSLIAELRGGRQAQRWQLGLDQRIADLGELDSRFAGAIEANATLIGRNESAAVTIQLDSDTLSYQAQPLAAVQTRIEGIVSERGFNGQIASLGLVSEYAVVSLREPAPLAIVRSNESFGFSLDTACFDDERADFCVSLTANETRSNLRADVRRFQLALLDPLLPNVRLRGRVSGSADVGIEGGTITGGGALQLADGTLTTANADTPLLSWQTFDMELRSDGGRLAGRLVGDLGAEDELALDFTLAGPKLNTLDAHLRAHTRQLAGVRVLVPEVRPLAGILSADLRFTGALTEPQMAGEFQLAEASIGIIDLGITAREVNLIARVESGQALDIDARARIGDGSVGMTGVLESFTPVRGAFQLRSEGLRFINSPEAQLYGDAALSARIDQPWVDVTGTVAIPRGHIKAVPNTAVTVSDDQVIVGELDSDETSNNWRAKGALQLKLGPELTLDAVGVKGNINGTLQLELPEEGSPRGRGEIELADGTFTVFRQSLTIERGALVFSGGPVANPGLDIRASRSVGSQRVGVLARGPANDPSVELFSDPPLSSSDTLSYLTLGKPVTSLAENEQGMINQAGNRVAMSGGNLVAAQVGRRLGLDDTSIEGTLDNAALVLGKYLSPRLYVSYGVGIAQAVDFLKLRYTLSRHWSLEAESGVTSSADLVYTIDR